MKQSTVADFYKVLAFQVIRQDYWLAGLTGSNPKLEAALFPMMLNALESKR